MEACVCISSLHAPQPPQLQISNLFSQPGKHHRRLNLRQGFRRQKGRLESGGGDWKMRPASKRKEEMSDDKWDRAVEESKEDDDVNEEVELMEMEAIMGEDDGKEPMDYKRRAGIFYKSSQMFQAIKDKQHHHCA
ncbi:hypothetical protein Lser_V15G09116 [Lactuca serriola]